MIKRIQITNMARFEAIDYALPLVCMIQGGNGAGKTGLLDCIRVLGESGHDPDIIRGNAAEGETIVTMDDDTQLRVRVTRTETWRGWKPKDGKRWIKGREEIDKIYRAIAYDPLKFLELSAKEQAETLAALSPVQATQQEIEAAVGEAAQEASGAKLRPGMTGLEIIAAIHSAIYDARHTLNVGADTQEKHAAELERALPPAAPEGENWGDRAAALQAQKESVEAEERKAIDVIAKRFQAAKDEALRGFRTASEKIDEEINAKIAALEQERFTRKEAESEACSSATEAARTTANEEAARVKSINKPILDKLTADLATAQERARADQQAEGTRKAVEVARQEAAAKRSRSKVLTGSLERLQALKLDLAKKLSIPGAVVEEGRIVREQDGGKVPLKRWNTADQMSLALKIGMKLGGGFVCVDHVEAFDKPHRQALLAACSKYAEKDGVQFVLASVDFEAGPLQVADAKPGEEVAVTT